MNFLIPCDDIIADIAQKHEALSINKILVIIGYQETEWMNNAPIKESKFPSFESLLENDENITVDNIVYIKYIDIFLWHKANKIDRFEGSGDTKKSEIWDKVKNKYLDHVKVGDDEKKDGDDDKVKQNKITLNINIKPQPLQGQEQQSQRGRYYYYWDNTASDIINNGFYEINNKNNGKKTKINVEKILKKSYKKTKVYYQNATFKFLSTKQLDSIYRNYENMEINIVNESTLNSIYRLNANQGKIFKKVCILNVYGSDNNGFHRNSTISHSLNRYYYSLSPNKTDESSEYLYTNTMVYSPNCIFFNDLNGNLTANHFKVSFITAYPVNCNEYYRIQRKMFNEPIIENKLKLLDDKLLNNNNNKTATKLKMKHNNKNKNNNKSIKRTQEETEKYIAKLNEMKDVIDDIMRNRIRRMIEIAIYNGCDAIIFDAFGCNNNYGNDIKKIANIFAGFIKTVYFNCFKSITFTILDHSINNNNRRNNNRNNKRKDVKSMISKFRIFQETFQDEFE